MTKKNLKQQKTSSSRTSDQEETSKNIDNKRLGLQFKKIFGVNSQNAKRKMFQLKNFQESNPNIINNDGKGFLDKLSRIVNNRKYIKYDPNLKNFFISPIITSKEITFLKKWGKYRHLD